ncbi:MAG: RIP metalloprotease RseP [Sideroxydans sp.]|nr:RIP metalloprotease RseP [Sideroxydans sp.]
MMTLLAFIGAIASLVVFHEYGHFLVARRCNVKVLRFSLGFGKVLYSKRFKGSDTEWVLSAIPLGGYVKMLDEREGYVAPDELPLAFNRKPVLQRMAIVVAGPLANFLLAIALYWGLFMYGVPGIKPMLGEVSVASAAAMAQLQAGDTVQAVNDDAIPSWQELRWNLLDRALRHETVTLTTLDKAGKTHNHSLALSGLQASDLDGEFMDKLGLHLYDPILLPVIGKLTADGVAQQAGLQTGDVVLRANGVALQRFQDLIREVASHAEQPLVLEVQRGAQQLSITLQPRKVLEGGKAVGKIGAGPQVDEALWQDMFTTVSYSPVQALLLAGRKTWETSIISLKMMGKMVLGEVSLKNLSGPITIADYAGQSASMGLVAYLTFLALVSISLGVLNLLPIPLLDGGHLLYYAAEFIKGSAVSEKSWEIGQKIGIALLGTMMLFAFYNDINRIISG